MKRPVKCRVDYTEDENDYGRVTPCVYVTCTECGKTEQSWGESDASVNRCLMLLSKSCSKRYWFIPYEND